MIGISIKNGCKNLYLHSKSFKITFKPSSYLMSICARGPVNTSTHTCNIDVTQTMAYCCSQKVATYYKNVIRNLERIFKLFPNTIWSLCRWLINLFFYLWSCSLEDNEKGSKLSEIFVSMCTASGFWNFAKHVHITMFVLIFKQIQ